MIRSNYKKFILTTLLVWNIFSPSFCQEADTVSFKINTRYSFYSYETRGELLLHVPQDQQFNSISADFRIADSEAGRWTGIPGSKIVRIPIDINLQPGRYNVDAKISSSGNKRIYSAHSNIIILSYKPNEVKTDLLTGGLIVNKRIFFPFGFYTYSPVYPTLPEEEVVKGFNLISPYQKILPETFSQRQKYMDRCAQLGMKVNYNLLSVSGGGGVGSKLEGISDTRKRELLVKEIETFRDHPALLAWYISDEPTGNKIAPDSLIKIYRIIKELDPWHPVTIVFMAPFLSSRLYADALDIVMADPYPVPDLPVTMVGDVTGKLVEEFKGRKPVWIVPQAFGGGELWKREPTLQELRSMTYQAIINGARGIQYFVRQGLNLFPKSTTAWNECGRMASEIAELTPWLLSDEETIMVQSSSPQIIASSAIHEGQLAIFAVNKTNSPQQAHFKIARFFSGKVDVLFENRSVNISGGNFTDILSPFGSQVYLLNIVKKDKPARIWTGNLVQDPGFEETANPGLPSACYARGGGDRGATYFLDTREHFEGIHSIRIITPMENKSVKLRFFPFKGRNGASYYISVWAKTDKEMGLKNNSENKKQYFEISLGDYGYERFELTDQWREYVTNVTIPYFNDQSSRTNIILQMPSEGVAWFDMLQAVEFKDFTRSVNPEIRQWQENDF
jgi:hypothetical protein